MATRREIQAVADRIAAAFSPERIILFGSHAYGTPTPDSDVDLLIALPFEGRPAAKAIEIRHAAQAPFALDLLAYPPDYIRTRVAMGDSFLKEITERGRVLYESSHV